MSKQKRHTPEEIIRLLRESEASGLSQEKFCQQKQISVPTLHRWRKKYGGMNISEARRHRELEKENARLKKLVADLSLDNAILKDIAQGNF